MTVMEAIQDRRSIRRYADRKVEPEKLAQVLEAGRLAPTARNAQTLEFHVVQSEELRRQIDDLNEQIAAGERAQQAMALLWKLERLYLAGDNDACRAVLAQLQQDELYLALPETTAAEGDSYETPRAAYERILADLTGDAAA